MNRRNFIQKALALLGVSAAMPVFSQQRNALLRSPFDNFPYALGEEITWEDIGEENPDEQLSQCIILQYSPVAGFQYYNGEKIWDELNIGDRLTLLREPDNQYDERAVSVFWQDQKLGYVSRTDNAAISHLLDTGYELYAEISALCESENPWDRVEFMVRLGRT